MDTLTVRTGSGNVFALRLPAGEAGEKLSFILTEIFRRNDETFKSKVIESTKELFPLNWQQALEHISEADARKLGKALLMAANNEKCACESKEFAPDFAGEQSLLPFSAAVIQAAYCYKWTLEYAASLPCEVLHRCLEVAGLKQSVPASVITLSPEEIKKAAARGAAAIRKYKEQN